MTILTYSVSMSLNGTLVKYAIKSFALHNRFSTILLHPRLTAASELRNEKE